MSQRLSPAAQVLDGRLHRPRGGVGDMQTLSLSDRSTVIPRRTADAVAGQSPRWFRVSSHHHDRLTHCDDVRMSSQEDVRPGSPPSASFASFCGEATSEPQGKARHSLPLHRLCFPESRECQTD